jgi:diguanylate cyclase (GGDEF)-like protein/PAS domain S-box-containing protein
VTSEDRRPAVIDDEVSVVVTRDEAALIISVGPEMTDLLGWSADQLIGRPSTEFIHPDDQSGAIAAWFQMIETPGEPHTWQGRYRTGEGDWKWIECVNVSRLDDPVSPVVLTTMRSASVDGTSLADELRDREELLGRLSEAMPIGMFQIDGGRNITFTNDRLHSILGHEASSTIDAEFSLVDGEDKRVLTRAVDQVLAGQGVDDIELRFVRFFEEPAEEHVCMLSMQPLTDAVGNVTGAVGCVSDVTEQVHLRRQLEQRANTDELTSCLNRAAILDALASGVDRRQGGHTGTGVIFVDLCRFKEVNDAFGHTVGDYVLKLAADRLQGAVRDDDQVGRFGGDEFLVVCPGVDSERSALEIATRIQRALTDELNLGTGSIELRASIGLAWCAEAIDADELVAQADQAMYRAKRAGSSAVGIFAHSG